jgi:hypothetical protein
LHHGESFRHAGAAAAGLGGGVVDEGERGSGVTSAGFLPDGTRRGRVKKAYCKYCGKYVGKVPDDATDVVCFKCNEARDGKGSQGRQGVRLLGHANATYS